MDAKLRPFVPDLVARRLQGSLDGDGPKSFGFEAACVMVDISGSVELAHALLESGSGADFDLDFVPSANRGADELSSRLNAIFREVLRITRQRGADVIRFLGDALLCLVYADPGSGGLPAAARRAASMCAELLGVQTDRLRLHIALSAGSHFALKLGGHAGKFDLSVVGSPLRDLSSGLSLARAGEVSISEKAFRAAGLGPPSDPRLRNGFWTLQAGPLWAALAPLGPLPFEPLEGLPARSSMSFTARESISGLRAFVPSDVESCAERDASFMTELRMTTCLFVRFHEFECPPEPPFPEDLLLWFDRCVRVVQEAVASTNGVIRSFFRDDKGFIALITYGLVGTADGDYPLRACTAAVRIRDAFVSGGLGPASIGVATGRSFAGLVGDELRCDYNVLGDSVNVAARLMAAHDGDVLADRPTLDAVHAEVESEALPPLRVKGKRAPLEVFRLGAVRRSGARRSIRKMSLPAPAELLEAGAADEAQGPPGARTRRSSRKRSSLRSDQLAEATALDLASALREEAAGPRSLVRGRALALGYLCDFLTAAAWKPGGAGVLLLTGDAGAGKTALADECVRLAEAAGLACLAAAGDALETSRPYGAFLDMLHSLVDALAGDEAGPAPAGPAAAAGDPDKPAARLVPRRASVSFGASSAAASLLHKRTGPAPPALRVRPSPLRPQPPVSSPSLDSSSPPPPHPARSSATPEPLPKPKSFATEGGGTARRLALRSPKVVAMSSPALRPPSPPPEDPSTGDVLSMSRRPSGVPRSSTSIFPLGAAVRPPSPSIRSPDSDSASPSADDLLGEDSPAFLRARRFLRAVDPSLATRTNAALLDELLPQERRERPLNGVPPNESEHQAALLLLLTSVFKAVLAGLRAALLVEDFHHLDSASVHLVENLAHASGTSILITSRTSNPSAYSTVKHCQRTRLLELPPLSTEETVELIAMQLDVAADQVPGWFASSLCEQSRGNPFAVLEIVSYLERGGLLSVEGGETPRSPSAKETGSLRRVSVQPAGEPDTPRLVIHESLGDGDHRTRLPVPDSLERIVVSRLDALPPLAALVCRLASVLGTRFSLAMAAEALARDVDPPALIHALRQLEAARLIAHVPSARGPDSPAGARPDSEYCFVQGLVAEALYRMLSAEDRNRLHRLAAEWLEHQEGAGGTEGAGDGPRRPSRAALLAYHWLRSGEAGAGVRYLDIAADEAYRAGAYAEAAELSLQALRVGEASKKEPPAPSKRPEPGPGGPGPGEALAVARRHLTLARSKFYLGRVSDASKSVERALRLLGVPTADAAPILRGSLGTLLRLLMRGPDAGRGKPQAPGRPGEEAARRLVLSRALALYCAILVHMGDVVGGFYFALRNVEIALADADSAEYGEACGFLHLGLRMLGMRRQAARWLEAGRRAAATPRGRPATAWLYVHQAAVLIQAGALEAAYSLCAEAIAETRRLGDAFMESMLATNFAYAAFLLGRYRESEGRYLAAAELSRRSSIRLHALWGLLGYAGCLLGRGGPPAEAEAALLEARREYPECMSLPAEMMWHHALMATALARSGRPAEAREEAERAMDAVHAHRAVFPVGRVLTWSFAAVAAVHLVAFYAPLASRSGRHADGRAAAAAASPSSPGKEGAAGRASPHAAGVALAEREAARVVLAGIPTEGQESSGSDSGSDAGGSDRDRRRRRSGSLLAFLADPTGLAGAPVPVERPAHSRAGHRRSSERRHSRSRRRSGASSESEASGPEAGGSRRGSGGSRRGSGGKRGSGAPAPFRDPLQVVRELAGLLERAVPSNALLAPAAAWARGRLAAARADARAPGFTQRRLRRKAAGCFREGAAGARRMGLRPWELDCLVELGAATEDGRERGRCAEMAAALAEDMECGAAAVAQARALRRASA